MRPSARQSDAQCDGTRGLDSLRRRLGGPESGLGRLGDGGGLGPFGVDRRFGRNLERGELAPSAATPSPDEPAEETEQAERCAQRPGLVGIRLREQPQGL